MRWGMRQLGLAAIDDVKAEADLGLVWSAAGQAQALVEQAAHRGDASLGGRLETLMGQANTWESTRAAAVDSDWNIERDRLLVEFDSLRTAASVVLEEQHKTTQFKGALVGASITVVGAGVLVWMLRGRKKR